MAKDKCIACKKSVNKNSHALQCSRCSGWNHVGCDGITEEDFVFLRDRLRFGFRWYCQHCSSHQMKEEASAEFSESIIEHVTSVMETMRTEIFDKMNSFEARMSSINCGNPALGTAPETFANIVKETLEQSKRSGEQPRGEGITVNAFGQTKTVQDQQVIIVKPRSGGSADPAKLDRATNDIRGVLKTVPVNNIRKTNTGSLVVKFPSAEAKSEASNLMSACFGNDEDFVVSQPKKMLPKMTLTGIPVNHPDGEIVESILNKNKDIEALVSRGLQLELLFTRSNDESGHKIAILRMAPEIRAAVNKVGGYIFVGLTRCKAYDRFWVTQCYHCQRFGHIATKCPMKDHDPVCGFCASSHRSALCPDKSAPKCVNCSSRAASGGSCGHYALSSNCPMMILQRERVIENTNLVSSKNP